MINFSNVLEGATTGAIGGSAVPGLGTVAGGFLGAATGILGGIFGGGVPGHENSDADKIAAAVGITRQQAMDLCAMVEDEAGKGGPNFDDIVKDYASHPQEIIGLIPRYNRKHPESPIYQQQVTGLNQGLTATQQIETLSTPSLATPPYVATSGGSALPNTSNTTTYALIGGGALALILVLFLLLKK